MATTPGSPIASTTTPSEPIGSNCGTDCSDHPHIDEQAYRHCPPPHRPHLLSSKAVGIDRQATGWKDHRRGPRTQRGKRDCSRHHQPDHLERTRAETCDTTGTETDTGYTEAQFNYNVAEYLTADLEAEGATVVLTRTSNAGVGPCVTERAAIGNSAHADAAISIHADGGPPMGRGFAVLEPIADGPNNAIIAPPRPSASTFVRPLWPTLGNQSAPTTG